MGYGQTKASCRTSKGVEFARVKNPKTGELGWYDRNTKTAWYDEVKTGVNQYEAEMHCAVKPGSRPPSRDDFHAAEKNGFREIFRGVKDKWVWSSSGYSHYPDDAFGFDGNDGYVDYGSRFNSFDYYAAACVGR